MSLDKALGIVRIFLETAFEGARHIRRIAKIEKDRLFAFVKGGNLGLF